MKKYTGYGVAAMLKCAYKHGLTSDNSILTVQNTADLDSKWTITVK